MDDREGFRMFYDACRDELHAAVAVTLGDPQLAVDAVDEAFVRAAERWRHVRALDRPSGWVYRVAVNWATSWRRKWSRRPTLPVEALDRPFHDLVDDVELAELLFRLPLSQRQILVLRYVLGYSVPETAAALDVAEGTVKSASYRARQQLHEELRQEREADDATA